MISPCTFGPINLTRIVGLLKEARMTPADCTGILRGFSCREWTNPTNNHLTNRPRHSRMPPEHVHIISAGENIHTAYPASFRILPTISYTIVFVDSAVHEKSSNTDIEKTRHSIRNAVEAVKEISASLSIPQSREIIYPPTYPAVRDALTRIRREHPNAWFTFDLSGGSKPLCLALFSFAPWLEGEVWSTFDEKIARNIPLPDRSVRNLLANPNYQTILAILIRMHQREQGTSKEWVTRQYIFKQLWSMYVPSRTKKPKPGDPPIPPVKNKRGITPAADLTHATFSGFMTTIRDAGLITEMTSPANKKEKIYRVTDHGEIAFRFFSDPGTNSLVQTILENK